MLTCYSRYQTVRQNWSSLPFWARRVLFLFALPGMLAAGLSILALGVSILALLLLTLPVYRLLTWLTGSGAAQSPPLAGAPVGPETRRHVDVRIIENEPGLPPDS